MSRPESRRRCVAAVILAVLTAALGGCPTFEDADSALLSPSQAEATSGNPAIIPTLAGPASPVGASGLPDESEFISSAGGPREHMGATVASNSSAPAIRITPDVIRTDRP